MIRLILALSLLAAAPAMANSNNQIPFHQKVELSVGQSIVIAGHRGDCGKRPTDVDRKRTRDTKLGTLSIGKWGITKSRTCNGWTPAVEIIFKARKKGRETITTAGNKIRVIVK